MARLNSQYTKDLRRGFAGWVRSGGFASPLLSPIRLPSRQVRPRSGYPCPRVLTTASTPKSILGKNPTTFDDRLDITILYKHIRGNELSSRTDELGWFRHPAFGPVSPSVPHRGRRVRSLDQRPWVRSRLTARMAVSNRFVSRGDRVANHASGMIGWGPPFPSDTTALFFSF
jgi:hypothetical protein